jgi:predicted DNA-binding transcriptional regulator YafY
MRADRLLSLVLLLQAHGSMTGRALAARLDVSERTVHRDMEALSAAGVPVYAQRGAHGGWRLDEDWRTRVPGLDEAELHALLMAQPRAIGDPRLAAAAERAMAKLMAALPSSLRDRAASIRQRLYVDPTGWRGTTEDLSALAIVQDAVARDRTQSMRYRQPGRPAEQRTVHPLGLVAKGTTWYLVADTPRGLRTYRVGRIEEATVLGAPCERPAGFDLETYWKASTAALDARHRYATTLRLDPTAAAAVRTCCRVATPPGDEPVDEDGWVTLRVLFDDEANACFVVMGFGPRVDVLEPVALAARVTQERGAAVRRGEWRK